MSQPALRPGDFVIYGGETGLVHSLGPRTCTVLPARPQRGAAMVWNVDLGCVPLATVRGPIRVSLYQFDQWPIDECIYIDRINASQQNSIRFALKRTEENKRLEIAEVRSEIFRSTQPHFRSGGRRVGAKLAGA